MPGIWKSVRVEAPVERVFEFVTQPENLPDIWPSMELVRNVERTTDNQPNFDWVYRMAGVRINGHSDTVELEPNRRWLVKSETGVPNTFDWRYEEDGDGTKVTLEINYTLPRVVGKLAAPLVRRVNDREAQALLDNLKQRMEAGAA